MSETPQERLSKLVRDRLRNPGILASMRTTLEQGQARGEVTDREAKDYINQIERIEREMDEDEESK